MATNDRRSRDGPMLKRTIVAATLLAMAWALPAWANDSDDCLKGETLVKTAPDRVFAACSRLAEQNVPGAQNRLGIMYDDGLGVR
jgi:TPR repeat protein